MASIYSISELVREVKVILDRNQEKDALLTPEDSDTLSQGELIESKLVDAARIIEWNAPKEKIDYRLTAREDGTTKEIGGYYYRVEHLPTDFWRLLNVSCEDWERNATIIGEEDERAKMVRNKWRVCGTPEQPITVVKMHETGGSYVESYVMKDKEHLPKIVYLPMPEVETDDDGKCLTLCTELKDAIMYMAASLVCVSLGDNDTAAGLRAVAYQLANIVEPQETQE